ncbi:MAG: hypothetical protein K1X79_09055 [Oligoflexia bacterium]|nr:hypothetical protein [Oligoflexia bacterium]
MRLIAVVSVMLSLPVMAEDQCQIARTAIEDASNIRGLRIRSKVPCLIQDKEQVKGYLMSAIKTKIPEIKLRMESLVFKTLGLIPQDFNYEQGIVDLYLSQIGGYYDPEAQHFVMAGWLPAVLQTTVAVHELTHALQDQYFNLKQFTDEEKFNSDELLARSALVEGDATAVMLDYARRLVGQPSIAKERDVESVMMQNVMGAALAGGNSVPQGLQLLLIFPYTSGLRFVHDALQHNGYSMVDKIFRQPPRSTEEILHPEKYYAPNVDFSVVDAASMVPEEYPKDAKPIYQDVAGEFVTTLVLGSLVSDKFKAAQAAAGWAGDRIAVFEKENGAQRVLVWDTRWDTLKDAEEFESVFRLRLQLKSADSLAALQRDGQRVRFVKRWIKS